MGDQPIEKKLATYAESGHRPGLCRVQDNSESISAGPAPNPALRKRCAIVRRFSSTISASATIQFRHMAKSGQVWHVMVPVASMCEDDSVGTFWCIRVITNRVDMRVCAGRFDYEFSGNRTALRD